MFIYGGNTVGQLTKENKIKIRITSKTEISYSSYITLRWVILIPWGLIKKKKSILILIQLTANTVLIGVQYGEYTIMWKMIQANSKNAASTQINKIVPRKQHRRKSRVKQQLINVYLLSASAENNNEQTWVNNILYLWCLHLLNIIIRHIRLYQTIPLLKLSLRVSNSSFMYRIWTELNTTQTHVSFFC